MSNTTPLGSTAIAKRLRAIYSTAEYRADGSCTLLLDHHSLEMLLDAAVLLDGLSSEITPTSHGSAAVTPSPLKLQRTPLTDATVIAEGNVAGGVVTADFARLLERELEAMRATWSESNRCYLEQFDRAERLQRELNESKLPVIGECEECGHKIVSPLQRFSK